MNVPRLIATAALAAGVACISACTSAGTSTGSPSAAPSVTPSSASPVPSMSGSADACGLVTSADVQSALTENVTATRPMADQTIGALAQVQGCVLTTNGPPLLGSAAATLQQLVNTLAGGAASSLNLSTGGVAVIRATTSVSIMPSPSSMPNGITPVPGIGQRAFVAASPGGGGAGFAQLNGNTAVLVVDMEGKQVTADQLTSLLRAATS